MNESDRCATCVHWLYDGIAWGECDKAKTRLNGDVECPESLALACAHGSGGASLWTAPDYGCVQWEPKKNVDE